MAFGFGIDIARYELSSELPLNKITIVSCTRFRRHQVRCFMEQEVCHGEAAV
jgi:hypothetical protein